ncbi:MAG TPA: ABC transporter ATP-binding protein [Verrucomicrobiae bacterium]|jgi:ABC-type lipoprotein export system ATPase subunit|nr:ABC transporter ATP-binding protein [Verrucomicrobiae bacterium]
MNNETLLRASDLHKRYTLGRRAVHVLRGVSLEVQRGEFVALQGASGAGKSTLLHLVGGLDTADKGEIVVCGKNLTHISEGHLSRFRTEKIGFIFQAYHLLPEFDALENVAIPGRIARHSAGSVRERARDLLKRVGLGERLDHRPYELSGGEQQRVAIARALINEPEVIIADEPTGNLDSRTGEDILNLLCEIRAERNTTLLIATHDSKVAHRAPRVVHLADGRIAPDETADGVRS